MQKTGRSRISLHITSNPKLIEIFFKQGIDINAQEKMRGDTPLHEKCRFGDCSTIPALLKCPILNLNIRNRQGNTPIFMPLENNFLEKSTIDAVINMLIASGKINMNKKNNNNQTFFYLYFRRFLQDMATTPPLFFTNFTMEERQVFLTNELHHLAKTFEINVNYGSHSFIQFCLDQGADINHRNYKKQRPLDVSEEVYKCVEGHLPYDNKAVLVKQNIYYNFLKKTPYCYDAEIRHRLEENGLKSDPIKKIMGYYTAIVSVHRHYAHQYNPVISKKDKKRIVGKICAKLDYINPYTKKQLTAS